MAMNTMLIARDGCGPCRFFLQIHGGGSFPINSPKPNTLTVKPTFLAISDRFQEDPHDIVGKKNPKTLNPHWFSVSNFKDKPSFALTIVTTSALMITSPLNALADTCQTDNSVLNMPLLLLVSIIGATVGGFLARQRKGELQRLNEQLRQINAALRRQAKIESYAPNLSYAPVGGGRIAEEEVIVDSKKQDLISRLKNGKTYLRNQSPEKAFLEFKVALELAQNLKYPREEKKAARGLGASLQRQGKYKEAINYHTMVLEISKREGEESGDTEAYGAIADCYTEIGDLEKAAKFYDHYIARLETD